MSVIYSKGLIEIIQWVFHRDSEVDRLAESHDPLLVEALRAIGATTWTAEDVLERAKYGLGTVFRTDDARGVKIACKLYICAEIQLRAHYRSLYGSCHQCDGVLLPAEPGYVRCGVYIDHRYAMDDAPYEYVPQTM